MMRRVATLLSIASVLVAANAHAQDDVPIAIAPEAKVEDHEGPPPPAPSPKNALSIQLMALTSRGLTLQYERFVTWPRRMSFVTSLGARTSGGEDYGVFEGAVGGEVRFWLEGKVAGYRFDGPTMVGPYFGMGVDFGMTRVSAQGHTLGTSMRIAEGISFGIRFAPGHRMEITPSIGTGFRTEFGPNGLAAWTRYEVVRLGLTAGVLF